MHSFMQKPYKRLKVQKRTGRDIGPFTREMISLLACTPDPFSSVVYTIDFENCRRHAKTAGTRRIMPAPIINKMIAAAIAENPALNRIVWGGSVYAFEEIHIANIVLIPGSDAATYVILENPHTKSLQDIQQELFAGVAEKKEAFAAPRNAAVDFLSRLCYRLGLFRCVGERRAFKIAYERGLMSNISLSYHVYDTPARFVMAKDVINPMNVSPRFHVTGPVRQPFVRGDTVIVRDVVIMHVTADHRIVNGHDSHRFGQSLERIAAAPGQYL